MASVCIIGAGPAGLVLALLLSKRKYKVTIVDRSTDHSHSASFDPSRSYTIDITGKGLLALAAAGVKEDLAAELLPFRGIRLFGTLDEPFVDPLAPGITGSRGEICKVLLRVLRERFPETEVFFDCEGCVVDSSVGRVHFGNRGERTFDVICAADGAGSRVREQAGFSFVSGAYTNHSTMIQVRLSGSLFVSRVFDMCFCVLA